MNTKTYISKPNNYYNTFPKIRDFYLLDKEEKIKDFKKTDMNDPEYIFIFTESEKKEFHEGIYKRKDFISDYDLVKIETKKSDVYLNFIVPKNRFNIGSREIRLLTEIKQRPSFIKEIYRRTTINFNTNKDIIFKEVFTIPLEQRFYNRIFFLHIYNRNRNMNQPPKNQNQYQNFNINHNNNNNNFSEQINNINNVNNNAFNNFNNNNFIDNMIIGNFRPYTNNYNTNEKVHLKGHTGFY